MRSTFLLIITILLVSTAQGAQNNGQIEQCQCEPLFNCRKEAKEHATPCIEKCRGKLDHKNWNKEEGLKCFDQPENTEHHQCMHEIALETCATEPGVMLNKNETLHFGHRRHHRKPRTIDGNDDELNEEDKHEEVDGQQEEDHQQHRPREHNKRAFYSFMRRHFGKSGQVFVRCMQECSKHRHHDKCPKELKCGVKKLPSKDFRRKTAECHKKQTPRRYEVCQCLKNAGMNHLDCNFGRSNTPPTTKKP